jgi:hypothetical protein
VADRPPAIARATETLAGYGERLDLIPPSAMLTSERAGVRRVGNLALTMRLLTGVRRPRWLLHPKRLPRMAIERREPVAVDEVGLAVADRLIAAHRKLGDDTPTGDMWAWISEHRQRSLATALAQGETGEVARLLGSMFHQDFVLGMAQGPILLRSRSALEDRIWSVKCLDSLVSLAEALGVVPVENPEQGGTGLALGGGLDKLVAALDEALGFRLDFPDVGGPSGLTVDGRLITPSTPDQVYAAVRLDEAIKVNLDPHEDAPLRITEIGGGYGALCFWLLQRRDAVDSYTIIDLPLVNAIQGFFLARALGPENVSFYGEPAARVRILPTEATADAATPFTVLVNKDSMPEMPQDAMEGYLSWARETCDGLFYSYNQEAAAGFLGKSQGVVHLAVSKLGGFERVRRETSWVRPGYVEEVYRMTSADEPSQRQAR